MPFSLTDQSCGLFSCSVYNCCLGCSTCSYSYRLCSTRHQLLPSIKHDFLVCYVVVTFSTAFHACFILECFLNDFWSSFFSQIRKTLNRFCCQIKLLQALYNNATWICIKSFLWTNLIDKKRGKKQKRHKLNLNNLATIVPLQGANE